MATRRGTADAQQDLAHGEYRLKFRSKPRPWENTLIEMAQTNYGIMIERTGGCVSSGPECFYDSSYNRVVVEHFTRQLGFDPLQRLNQQARHLWSESK